MGTELRPTLQTMAILKVLLMRPYEPRYGLDVSREAGLKTGTIYPALARLESAGWVSSSWEDIDEAAEGRRRRRYYRLTAEGEVNARRVLSRASETLSMGWLPSPGGAQA
jgi:PadR family transcriptional regulator, regulatory protein PadR